MYKIQNEDNIMELLNSIDVALVSPFLQEDLEPEIKKLTNAIRRELVEFRNEDKINFLIALKSIEQAVFENKTYAKDLVYNATDFMRKYFNVVIYINEILTIGNVINDFNRLGIEFRQTYKGDNYGVCVVTEKELNVLCNEPDIEGTWNKCGWRYCEGSNQNKPNKKVIINGKEIIAWYNDENPLKEFRKLTNYLCEEMGVSQPKNVCALSMDLAKHNNMKLSELFKIYEGN